MSVHAPSDDEFHSPEEKEDVWTHQKDIGFGGFGVVKLFLNETTGKKLVLKECRLTSVSQDFMDRWCGELKIIKRLHHPNIVRALDMPAALHYDSMMNVPFICMEYCEKGDLRQVLRIPSNCCGLTEEEIRQICGDVNAGIRFLHSQKVIHRDLKPENILIKCADGNKVVYKLTDFGYSKSYEQNSVCTSLVGTMQYVAPEVIKSRKYHSSVDFWGFGVVVFECITGKRPFLHGIPSNNIAWIDFVAQKQPHDIHIYYGKEGNTPIFSTQIPQPHRLSKTFESLITSWLQTALHYNPEMRGGRRMGSDGAPCLSNMDHILASKVVSAVCMSTGEEYFCKVEENTNYNMLKQQLPGFSAQHQQYQHMFQILPSGNMPAGDNLVGQDMPGTLGRVYNFNTTLEPSFKLIHSSNEAVSTITAYGDSKLNPEELREVYAHVFFHIREHYTFFKRLQEGHSAMLYQLNQHCKSVQEQQSRLADSFLVVKEIVDLVSKTNLEDCGTLSSLLQQDKVPQHLSEYHTSWQTHTSFLQKKETDLQTLRDELSKLREETNSYVCMADDLQTNYDSNYSRLEEYKQNYVVAASDLYQEVKTNRNFVQGKSMQDILLRATQEAQSVIVDCLNGYNFGQTFLTLSSHLQVMAEKMRVLEGIRTDVMQTNDTLRKNLWDIIRESNSPTNSLRRQLYRISSADSTLAMNIDGSNDPAQDTAQDSVSNLQASAEERSIHGLASAQDLRRQYSSASASSVDSVNDPKLVQSIHNMHRLVSEEENTILIQKSKELRSRFQSLSRSSSTVEANGKSSLVKSGGQ